MKSIKSIIKVKNLTKNYKDLKAVDQISFEIKDGETFGILGPNGAGKTTTLEMMESLRKIDGGEVIIAGLSVIKKPIKVRQIIGVQLQASSYFEFLNIREILALFAEVYHKNADVDEILKEVSLTNKIKSYVNNLSGGQKQRLSIASALVNDPKVLFLDEPTTGLDPQARRNIWKLIRGIKAKGKTILLTTHYMEEAQILCDRVAIMDYGKIIALGTPNQLIKKHGGHSAIEFRVHRKINPKNCQKMKNVKKVDFDAKNQKYTITTDDTEMTIMDLFSETKKMGCHLLNLKIHQPTLEDVFLNLTGRKLRE